MSQSHIPQPNSQSAAPAETFDSTADAPHGPTVSSLGSPGPTPGEIVKHTGQQNSFDISIHRQFIPLDTFVWSVGDQKGELLWYKPIHPSSANPLIAYLSGMYNTWGGSIEYNFKVAGTGFHAGALAFVRIPPNYNPTDFAGATEWGAFEYCVIDPKTLEVMSVDVIDQRPVMYHYMNWDEKVPNSFGGWIACYVLIPLNTSSSGSQQIAVQSFARPGMTFKLSQLIIPQVNKAVPDPDKSFLHLFSAQPATLYSFGAQTGRPMYGLETGSRATQAWPSFHVVNFAGVVSTSAQDDGHRQGNIWQVKSINGSICSIYRYRNPVGLCVPKGASTITWSQSNEVFTRAVATVNPVIVVDKDISPKQWYTQITVTGSVPGKNAILWWDPVGNQFTNTDDQTWPDFSGDEKRASPTHMFKIPAPNEVFVYYSSAADNYACRDLQLTEVGQYFLTKQETKAMGKDQAMLLNVVDDSNNTIVLKAKLYYDGFMTTSASNENKRISSKVSFKFDSIVSANQPIPAPTSVEKLMLAIEDASSRDISPVQHRKN